MPKFSQHSTERLATCDKRLQEVLEYVISHYDCSVLCGQRGQEDQEEAFAKGNTKVHFPNSRHNKTPSQAVDVMPYPIIWPSLVGLTSEEKEKARAYATVCRFAGFVQGVAAHMGYKLTWGGDWNRNGIIEPGDDWDLPHFQVEGQN